MMTASERMRYLAARDFWAGYGFTARRVCDAMAHCPLHADEIVSVTTHSQHKVDAAISALLTAGVIVFTYNSYTLTPNFHERAERECDERAMRWRQRRR